LDQNLSRSYSDLYHNDNNIARRREPLGNNQIANNEDLLTELVSWAAHGLMRWAEQGWV